MVYSGIPVRLLCLQVINQLGLLFLYLIHILSIRNLDFDSITFVHSIPFSCLWATVMSACTTGKIVFSPMKWLLRLFQIFCSRWLRWRQHLVQLSAFAVTLGAVGIWRDFRRNWRSSVIDYNKRCSIHCRIITTKHITWSTFTCHKLTLLHVIFTIARNILKFGASVPLLHLFFWHGRCRRIPHSSIFNIMKYNAPL